MHILYSLQRNLSPVYNLLSLNYRMIAMTETDRRTHGQTSWQ